MKALISALAIAACMASPAGANGLKCFDANVFKKAMEGNGNERIFSELASDNSHVLEVWVTQLGQWIATITSADNVTCLANGGAHYVGPLQNA